MNYDEIMPATPDYSCHRELLLKWLPILLYTAIAGIVMSLATALLNAIVVTTLLSSAVSLVMVVALWHLAPVNGRYRKAAILSAVSVGAAILIVLVPSLTLITFAASICSIIASWQEMNAHSEITAPLNRNLAQKWRALFWWQMGIGLISGMASSVGVVIAVLADADQETIVMVTLLATVLVSAVFALIRILYLKRTMALYQEG